MSKKARRRHIMEQVGFTEKRIERLSDDKFVYLRGGDLLKIELKKLMEYLGIWKSPYKTQHKRAWRGHIRDSLDISHDSQMGWERFSKDDLHDIWIEVRDHE